MKTVISVRFFAKCDRLLPVILEAVHMLPFLVALDIEVRIGLWERR